MTSRVITTFSIDGYELYGKKMVNTWLKFWPKDISLTVYTEGFKLEEKDPRLFEIDINEACPSLQVFKDKSLKLIDPNNKKSKTRISKAIRWSHKVYAMAHALNHRTTDYLIFLDGDTYSFNSVPSNLAENLAKDHLFAVHFESLPAGLHFETGLVSFNMKHNQMLMFKDQLQRGYDNLDIHSLQKSWDGYWIAHLYQKFRLDVLNLAQQGRGVFSNPLVRGILAHDAGQDKFRNSSIEYDKYSGRKLYK